MENITIEKPTNIDVLRVSLNQVREISNPILINVSDSIFTNIGINELDGIPIKSFSESFHGGISIPEMKTDDDFIILTDKTFST